MTKSLKGLLCAALAMFCSLAIADAHAYTDGPVTQVSSIRTLPGQFDAYMKFLSQNYKKIMEEQKKAGIIIDWKVYQAFPRSPSDPDLFLTITYKNWAA